MSEQNSTNGAEQQEEFGIGAEVNSNNVVNFPAGFNKAELVSVKTHEIGKGDTKYPVLDFKFVSIDKINTFIHREFIPKGKATTKENEKENYDTRKGWFNSRVKHIFEVYVNPMPDKLGSGAKGWGEFFKIISDTFNAGKDGKEIYINYSENKATYIPVWIKSTYSSGGDIQFPLLPNFIERITSENVTAPKKLEITKFDTMKRPEKGSSGSNSSSLPSGQVLGGTSVSTNNASDMGF